MYKYSKDKHEKHSKGVGEGREQDIVREHIFCHSSHHPPLDQSLPEQEVLPIPKAGVRRE